MSVQDYLAIIERNADAGQRALAARALLEELASGAELTRVHRRALEERFASESDVGVAALLKRAVNRLRVRDLVDGDPGARFDRKLGVSEREALRALVARLRVVADGVQGAGEFDQRYEVVREITDGGMGRVVLGRRRADGALVAIKVLLDQFMDQESVLDRFRREAAILERLDHPHVIRLYEWGEIDRRIYLVTEYLPAGDLADRLAAGPIPRRDAWLILDHVLAALEACHDAGIIHRDVKPGNVFLDDPARGIHAKLGDFGLAKDVRAPEGVTLESTLMGTPPYLAPEQEQDPRSVVPATDLYSFGVMAYELLSGGRLPVGNYELLLALDPTLPAGLDTVIARCLQRRPADRWPTVADLRAALLWLRDQDAGG